MSTAKSATVPFADTCALIQEALTGSARKEILDVATRAGDADRALDRLRDAMRKHVFRRLSDALALGAAVREFDRRTREEGFHVLHAWDHNKHEFTRENTPVLLLDRFARSQVPSRSERFPLALLLDHYFFYVLALLAMRAWDEGDPDANLDRVTELVARLQGPSGSGHAFVDNSATLFLMAISHFHPDETAYPRLLDKIGALDPRHRILFARAEAAVLGSHLRWGFRVLYKRDLGRMRADNVGDYPWLLFSLGTLLEEWVRRREAGADVRDRDYVLEPLIDGLTPDPWAFDGKPPPSLEGHAAEHGEFRELLDGHRDALLEDLSELRPARDAYSPLSYHCNFPHNAIMAKVAVALVDAEAPNLPVDALFTRHPPNDPGAAGPEQLARTLMAYSGERPERLGRHGARLIIYDPSEGLRSYKMALKALGAA